MHLGKRRVTAGNHKGSQFGNLDVVVASIGGQSLGSIRMLTFVGRTHECSHPSLVRVGYSHTAYHLFATGVSCSNVRVILDTKAIANRLYDGK
jgi:hypothetical protein